MKAWSLSLRFSAVAASIGLLSFGVAAAVGSFSRADAQGLGPEVTGGTHPYVSFSGSAPGGNFTVYTVPSDRILVVTGASMSTVASLYQGATLKVHGGSLAMLANGTYGGGSLLNQGHGHLVFDPGSTVVINGSTGYYIEGYLAHP
jgi:hypothetical protein